jgi:hypothetical protein
MTQNERARYRGNSQNVASGKLWRNLLVDTSRCVCARILQTDRQTDRLGELKKCLPQHRSAVENTTQHLTMLSPLACVQNYVYFCCHTKLDLAYIHEEVKETLSSWKVCQWGMNSLNNVFGNMFRPIFRPIHAIFRGHVHPWQWHNISVRCWRRQHCATGRCLRVCMILECL